MKKKRLFYILLPLTVFISTLLFAAEQDPEKKESSGEDAATCRATGGKKMRMRRGTPPPSAGHPLLFVLENSNEFTEEERVRLKKLASEDPARFNREMHRHFQQKRKENAEKLLKLRADYLNAKDDRTRKITEDAIRKQVQSEVDRQLLFQTRIMESIEGNIRMMQKHLASVRKNYDERVRSKDAHVEKELKKILDPEKAPERLVRESRGIIRPPKKHERKMMGPPPPPPGEPGPRD